MVQKKTVTRLQEYAESIINTMREPLIALDQNLRVVSASRSFYEVFKVKPEETVGQLIYDLGNKQWDIPMLRKLLEDILPKKTTFDDYEVEHIFDTIGRRIMLLNARQIERGMGKERIILLAIEDITERKRLQEESEAYEEHYRSAFEASHDGLLLIHRSKGDILDSNPLAQELLGYSKEEFLKNNLWGIGVVKDDKDFQEALSRLERDGVIYYDNISVKNKAGLFVNTEVILVDKVKFIQCNIRDITERRLVEETLKKSEEKYRSIFENVQDVYYETLFDGTILEVSPSIESISKGQYKRTDLIGKSMYEFYADIKDRDTIIKAIQKTGRVSDFEVSLKNRDGSYIPCSISAKMSFDVKGQPDKIIGSMRDIAERKQDQERIRQSEEQFRLIAENITDLIAVIDIEGKRIYSSPSYKSILGDPESLRGTNSFQEIHPEDREKIRRIFHETVRTGIGQRSEYRFVLEDGSIRYIESQGSVIRDENGNTDKVVVVSRDITERKQTEQELRESKALIEAVVENVPLMIFLKEAADLRFVIFNRAGEELLGYDRKILLGRNNLDLFPPEQAAHFMAKDREVLDGETGMLDIPEEPIMTAKKGQRLLHTRKICIKGADGVTKYLLGISDDITERKRAEEELKKSEGKFRAIFDSTNDGMFLIDLNARKFLMCNIACAKMLGYTQEEFSTLNIDDIHPKEDLPFIYEQIGKFSRGEEGLRSDIRFERKDGSIFATDLRPALLTIAEKKYLLINFNDITERKRAEEELKFRNIILNTQQEASIDGILVVDKNGMILSYNQPFIEMWGIPSEVIETRSDELVLKAVMDKLEEPQRFIEKVKYLYVHQNETSREEIALKDGRIMDRYSAPMLGANARYYGRVWYFRDITDRKRAEEALRETRDYLNNLLSFANAPIMVWDNNNKITMFNLAFERLTGYIMYDVLGKHPEVLFSDDKRKKISTLISRTSDGENLISIELPVRCKDGSVCNILWNTSNIYTKDAKTIISTIAHGQDITKRKLAEEALQESELRFRSLYENATIGLYRTTPDGKILLANPALVKILGYTSFEILAERNLEKDGFESSSERKKFLEKIERDGVVHGYDSKWTRRDGKTIFVLESARVISDSQGKTLYYDGTVEDITERRQMEGGLRQMQKMEGLGTLAGGIAHDFNNILGIILAYITSTKQHKDDAKKLDLAVDTIVKAVERGKTLVQQILMFARKTDSEFGPVKVNDVVMEIMVMIFETFPKTLTYAQNFDKGVSYISADRSQLYQLLLNLCVNARDAMPKGGVLAINTRMVSVENLRYQHPAAVASSYVCIEVSDTGEGMTAETRERIFEPFFTTKEQGKGTGLGLAVVFGIVQTHKGFIDVESELGKGTTFSIYLPASQIAEPISIKDGETLEEIPGGTETLLIVEDEEMLMMSLRMALVDKGYNIISAGDGLEAVNIYKKRMKEIGLVLTDLGLPKMSGMEECAQIKKLNPNARMIVATGYLDPEMKSEFLKAGVQHFLFKPYDLKQVLKVIREALEEKRAL